MNLGTRRLASRKALRTFSCSCHTANARRKSATEAEHPTASRHQCARLGGNQLRKNAGDAVTHFYLLGPRPPYGANTETGRLPPKLAATPGGARGADQQPPNSKLFTTIVSTTGPAPRQNRQHRHWHRRKSHDASPAVCRTARVRRAPVSQAHANKRVGEQNYRVEGHVGGGAPQMPRKVKWQGGALEHGQT